MRLIMAVREIDKATSPFANEVKIFEVTPPGAAAIIITPKASSAGKFHKPISKSAIKGNSINWEANPIIKSRGILATLVKSAKVSPKPKANIINAIANGSIISVTIPIAPPSKEFYSHLLLYILEIFAINLAIIIYLNILTLR